MPAGISSGWHVCICMPNENADFFTTFNLVQPTKIIIIIPAERDAWVRVMRIILVDVITVLIMFLRSTSKSFPV